MAAVIVCSAFVLLGASMGGWGGGIGAAILSAGALAGVFWWMSYDAKMDTLRVRRRYETLERAFLDSHSSQP
ncbi:MAG TPA: hypothetical protein VEA69_17860 [Tepidisphaeraceae bacterium]|nr:hypothetical protein [Tepidisphaeraceae bacterium]